MPAPPGSGLRCGVVGLGAVGGRVVRQLLASDDIAQVVVSDPDPVAVGRVLPALVGRGGLGRSAGLVTDALDVVVLAGPTGTHADQAADHLAAGRRVVSTSDDLDEVRALLRLDRLAVECGVSLVVGAAFAPGLTCLLARAGARGLERVSEIHVARAGTGGPACARQFHASLSRRNLDWRDGAWVERQGGSGRELVWFPGHVGAQDCYRAELVDPVLLVPTFPGVERVTSRRAATRRDRLTATLPMLRRPHPEGMDGAVRVEVRGTVGGARRAVVLGVSERPALAAAAVAAVAAAAPGLRPGAAGLSAVEDPRPLLAALGRRGVHVHRFEGQDASGDA